MQNTLAKRLNSYFFSSNFTKHSNLDFSLIQMLSEDIFSYDKLTQRNTIYVHISNFCIKLHSRYITSICSIIIKSYVVKNNLFTCEKYTKSH